MIRRKTSEANISWYSYIAIEPQLSVLHTKPSADISNAMRAQKEREYDYDYDYDYDDYDRGIGDRGQGGNLVVCPCTFSTTSVPKREHVAHS